MLLFIKNFFSDLWDTILTFNSQYRYQIMAGLVAIIILLLLFGCAGSQVAKQAGTDSVISSDESYVNWTACPPWMAKDFLDEPGWGLMDGLTFDGKHGFPCHLLKIDLPPYESCDYAVIICENGQVDNRHGENTPLVVTVGSIECSEYDGMVETIKENF